MEDDQWHGHSGDDSSHTQPELWRVSCQSAERLPQAGSCDRVLQKEWLSLPC